MVIDGSGKNHSKKLEKSLNEAMVKGPNLLPLVQKMLLRSRWQAIVCQGDVSKAFYNILLNPQQKDLTRLLWRENESNEIWWM